MTAEIAILNRSAVALAADSAVTIRFGDTEKIYNSAEKIFEFSRHSPVGLMINNAVDFMGIPWDVLIRRYRALHDDTYTKVADASQAFLTFLTTLPVTTAHEDSHLEIVLVDLFTTMRERYYEEVGRRLQAAGEDGSVNGQEIFLNLVETYTQDYASTPLEEFLTDKSATDFTERYGGVADRVAATVFEGFPFGGEETERLHVLALALIKAKRQSITSTGLIFAGYATDDFFPSIVVNEVDGRFFGVMKGWEIGKREVDRSNNRAIILPFAQREMVDRFMYGVDAQFESDVIDNFGAAAKTITARLSQFINELGVEGVTLPPEFADELAANVTEMFASVALPQIKSIYLRDIFDIVTAMPKAELAQMAESLVSLTSIKRKMSVESETVGGPVDVALITRGEGFIWISRKHYFDHERNPGFFTRNYNLGETAV